jgi:hypothetical protein
MYAQSDEPYRILSESFAADSPQITAFLKQKRGASI